MLTLETLNEIREKADIVTVIGHYLKLVKKGANYAAVCPFHDDTRPSLSISPAKQIFKCFVCNTAGNCFTFVQKYEHVEFLEAVKKVCQICNIEAPGLDEAVKRKPRENQEVYDAVRDMAAYYHFALRQSEGQEALQYLQNRQISEDVIDHFTLGYAPSDSTRSIKVMRERKGYSVDVLEKAGLLAHSSSGFFDRYRDRIMFPVENVRGDLVGFSGRIFRAEDEGQSKYINSPETLLFRKSELLYNFKNARETCRKDGYLYVLEGFMDVIALYRAGINSAVALMGTALTKDHLALFRELGIEIRLCLDSDGAGQLAEHTAFELLTKAEVPYKVVAPFPDGKDPDEYLGAYGPEVLKKALFELREPVVHDADYMVRAGLLPTKGEKAAFVERHVRTFARYDELYRNYVVADLAHALGLEKEEMSEWIAGKLAGLRSTEPDKSFVDVDAYAKMTDQCAINEIIRSSGDSHLRRWLYGIESGLLAKVARNRRAYERFHASGAVFYQKHLLEVYNYLNDYYEKDNSKEMLDIEDYQAILDCIDLKEDVNPTVRQIFEVFKTCPFNAYDEKSFEQTMQEHEKKAAGLIKHKLDLNLTAGHPDSENTGDEKGEK